jgi:mRNA-degrading endonuclease toxin of MazEF toxin-antitoxin module
VLADQVRSVDWSARGVEHAGRLPSETEGLVRGTARRLLE